MGMFDKLRGKLPAKTETEGPVEKKGIEEKELLSLLEGNRPYVVGEEIRLMGSPTMNFDNGAEIVILKPGDEIRLFLYITKDDLKDMTPKMLSKGKGKVSMVIIKHYNSEYPTGKDFLFFRENLEGRKIKIDIAAQTR